MTRLRLLTVEEEEEEEGEEYLVNNMEVEVAATDTFYWCSVHRSGRHFVKAKIKLNPKSIAIFLTNPLLRLGQQFEEKMHVLRCQCQIILDDNFRYQS